MSNPKESGINLSPEQLKELMVAMAAELRKPADPTEQEQAQIQNDLQMRRERGETELQKIANKRAIQSICQHTRPVDGTTHCVHIYGTNNLTDYMICQGCGAQIHAEPRPAAGSPLAKELEHHIFDTRMFNQHYMMSNRRTSF